MMFKKDLFSIVIVITAGTLTGCLSQEKSEDICKEPKELNHGEQIIVNTLDIRTTKAMDSDGGSTNTNDSGPGSLSEALCFAQEGPRIIIFKV